MRNSEKNIFNLNIMAEINKIAQVALLTTALSSPNALSNQTNQTVDTLKQEVALLCEEKKGEVTNQTKSQTSREKLLAECGLEMPKLDEENASNKIRDYIISLGLNPTEMEWTTVVENNYLPGQFQESITLDQLGLTGINDFTVENISGKFEWLIQKINEFQESYESKTVQYIPGDWTSRFENELAPNEDEVELLNEFIASLDGKELKPLPFVNALTWLIALSKYSQEDISELNEWEKAVLLSNVHSVIAVIDAEKVQGLPSLVLPKWMIINGQELQSDKTYSSIPVDKEIVQMISKAGVELPVELVNGFEDIYKEYQIILAKIQTEADSKITKIEKQLEKVTDERRRKIWERRIESIKAETYKVNQWFDSLDTNYKLYALEMLESANDLVSERDKDNLLENAVEAVYATFIKEWNEHTDIWAFADYLMSKWVSKEKVDDIFIPMLKNRMEIAMKEYAESEQWYAESEQRYVKAINEWKELDKIIVLQKQILEAKKKFDKNASYASL